jgi:hypothetical protein
VVLGLSGKPEKLIDVARCLGDHGDYGSGAVVVRFLVSQANIGGSVRVPGFMSAPLLTTKSSR